MCVCVSVWGARCPAPNDIMKRADLGFASAFAFSSGRSWTTDDGTDWNGQSVLTCRHTSKAYEQQLLLILMAAPLALPGGTNYVFVVRFRGPELLKLFTLFSLFTCIHFFTLNCKWLTFLAPRTRKRL